MGYQSDEAGAQPGSPMSFEPIAIIGVGCRLPGEADSPSKLWDLLEDGRSAQSPVPENRFRISTWQHPDPNRPGSIPGTGGYFLSHDDRFCAFDPSFFGITPKEASAMDPQQRKLLEVVYETFESAGATLEQISGSQTACYVGCFTSDWKQFQTKEPEYGHSYKMTVNKALLGVISQRLMKLKGGGLTILSNRINYVFNMKGPSLTIDTACSSSLYALHLACHSLMAGDCTGAIVGGSNLILGVEQHIGTVDLGVLSPTSTCHTFDEAADGFGRADGICAIYIKKLADAIDNGDPIRAIIRSTAVNSNGKSIGITHPNAADQEALIRAAYEKANISLDQTGYFECHGTGTPVGDPIECAAVGNVFASGRSREKPLLIGSVKPNLGHTEGASGLTSLLKVVLSLERGIIPATIGISKLNPNIDFKEDRIQVVRSNTTWPSHFGVRRASVNSFGYGGANAHVILEAAPSSTQKHALSTRLSRPMREFTTDLLPHSLAFDGKEVHDAISSVSKAHDLEALAYTLATRRTRFRHRAFTLASTNDWDASTQNVVSGRSKSSPPTLAFAFTGQGAQWPQMGYELLHRFPLVRKTFTELQAVLDGLPSPPGWSMLEALAEPPRSSSINDSARSQPLCTALQISIVLLLESWGVRPKFVVGHSSGEVAAAFAAGLLTAAEAIGVAYYRGVAVTKCHVPGAMMAAGLGATDIAPYVKVRPGIVVACHNSPRSVTISGDEAVIDELLAVLQGEGHFARKLMTSGNAYHSHLVREAGKYYQDCFENSLPNVTDQSLRTAKATMYSCMTGGLLGDLHVGIEYWRRNLENPVLFDEAMQCLLREQNIQTVIEIGPHSALLGPFRQISLAVGKSADDVTYLPSLIRGSNNVEDMLRLAGSLFIQGYPMDIDLVNSIGPDISEKGLRKVISDLPTYQWNYEATFWEEHRVSHERRYRNHCRHDLLGSLEPGSSRASPLWRNRLTVKDVPWLLDHKVGKNIIFPAAGYVSMAIEAVSQIAEDHTISTQGYTLQSLAIKSALILPEEEAIEVLFNLRFIHDSGSATRSKARWFDFKISSVTSEGKWTEHAAGLIYLEEYNTAYAKGSKLHFQASAQTGNISVSDRRWYTALSAIGLEYGSSFQALSEIKATEETDEAFARISLDPTAGRMMQESEYPIHPATMDACLQIAIFAGHGEPRKISKAYIPVEIRSLTVWKYPKALKAIAGGLVSGQSVMRGLRSAHATCQAIDNEGRLLMEAEYTLRSLESGVRDHRSGAFARQPYTRLLWKPDIDQLRPSTVAQIFPVASHGDEITQIRINELEELCMLCIVDCDEKHPSLVTTPEGQTYLHKFHSWVQSKANELRFRQPVGLSSSARNLRINELEAILQDSIPESKLIRKLASHYGDVIQWRIDACELVAEHKLAQGISSLGSRARATDLQLRRLMELFGHKDPRMRIIEIGSGRGEATASVLAALGGQSYQPQYMEYRFTDSSPKLVDAGTSAFRQYKNVEFAVFDIEKDLSEQSIQQNHFDLIIASHVLHETGNIKRALQNCHRLLKPDGKLIIVETTTESIANSFILSSQPAFWNGQEDERASSPFLPSTIWHDWLKESNFTGTELVLRDHDDIKLSSVSVMVSKVARKHLQFERDDILSPGLKTVPSVWLIYYKDPSIIVTHLENICALHGMTSTAIKLTDVSGRISKGSRIIMVAEVEQALLARLTSEHILAIQKMVNTAASCIWVTRGGLMDGKFPDYSLISGLFKCLRIEQPSLHISHIDLDPNNPHMEEGAELVLRHELDLIRGRSSQLDTTLRQKGNTTYIARYMIDEVCNARFESHRFPSPKKLPLKSGYQIDFHEIGKSSTFYFRPNAQPEAILPPNHVMIDVPSYSLNKSEAAIIRGQQDATYLSQEFVGRISRAAGPTSFQPGEFVIGLFPGRFNSSFSTNDLLCHKVPSTVQRHEMLGFLGPCCASLHILCHLGRVRCGDTVLVNAGVGNITIAAIQIALEFKCNVLVTYGSDTEKDYLHAFGLVPEECFISTNSSHFRAELQRLTYGHGVDLAISTTAIPDLQNIWKSIARCGRLVLIDSEKFPDLNCLDKSIFKNGASLSCVNFSEMLTERPSDVSCLMQQAMELYHRGSIKPPPPQGVFDISQFESAVATVSQVDHFGPGIVRFSDQSVVPVLDLEAPLRFNPEATYILVGCLGGLGRSLTLWMVSRGARHFVFLSRSGLDKPEAARHIKLLEKALHNSDEMMSIKVVRGDVSIESDVNRAIAEAKGPIRGVIQAAMALDNSLFQSMTAKAWNAVVQPKLAGSMNLHNALRDEDLDFFVMTSSLMAATGGSTQSNYAAANAALDSIARHRWNLGLQATSVGLGMIVDIGHVEAHPDVEEALRRNGAYGIGEDEYLQIMEDACRRREHQAGEDSWDTLAAAHVITGMDPTRLTATHGAGSIWREDSAFRHMILAMGSTNPLENTEQRGERTLTQVKRMLEDAAIQGGETAVRRALQVMVVEQISKLSLMPVEKLNGMVDRPLADFGMGSLTTAELRTWAWRHLKADIPFMQLLEGGLSIDQLSKLLFDNKGV